MTALDYFKTLINAFRTAPYHVFGARKVEYMQQDN
jgi:hypothetical protein